MKKEILHTFRSILYLPNTSFSITWRSTMVGTKGTWLYLFLNTLEFSGFSGNKAKEIKLGYLRYNNFPFLGIKTLEMLDVRSSRPVFWNTTHIAFFTISGNPRNFWLHGTAFLGKPLMECSWVFLKAPIGKKPGKLPQFKVCYQT